MSNYTDITSEKDELEHYRAYLADDLVDAANNTSRTTSLQQMLAIPVNPDAISKNGKTALCCAAFSGYRRHVRILLEAGADPNLVEPSSGRTPMLAAIAGENTELLEMMLIAGANPTILGPDNQAPLQKMDGLVSEGTMNIARSIAARLVADASLQEMARDFGLGNKP